MPTHVALLRGINVGGRNKVAMANLRKVMQSLGHGDVATHIQSGNVVFTSNHTDTSAIAAELGRALAEALGVGSSAAGPAQARRPRPGGHRPQLGDRRQAAGDDGRLTPG